MQTASTLQPGDIDAFEDFLHTLPIESILLAKVVPPQAAAGAEATSAPLPSYSSSSSSRLEGTWKSK
jgi:hypothetical protein